MTGQKQTNEEIVRYLQTVKNKQEAIEIIEELWQRNIRFVKTIVHRVTGLSELDIDFEDMTQQAFFGFHSAIYTYDASKGIKFSSYAGKRIEWELCRYYDRNGYTVRIPAFMKKRIRDCEEKKKQLESETGTAITYEAALKALNLSSTAITGTLITINKLEMASLDNTILDDSDSATLLDMLASEEDIEDAIIAQEWHRELHELLTAALQDVPIDAREIIIRQYYHGIRLGYMEKEYGLTRQTLYNKKQAAFRSIRTGKYGKDLASFMPSTSSFERAQRRIKQDKEAIEQLHLTDTEKGLLII